MAKRVLIVCGIIFLTAGTLIITNHLTGIHQPNVSEYEALKLVQEYLVCHGIINSDLTSVDDPAQTFVLESDGKKDALDEEIYSFNLLWGPGLMENRLVDIYGISTDGKVYYRYCNLEKKYYNTSVSRCYVTLTEKTKSAGWFEKFRRVFQGKKLVVVEGTGTHNGVGNDLFDMAESVERIICPGRNAYSVREKILQVCLEYSKDRLFLFSLGITAKALVEEMFLKGYRVIDIGNLDMEYEWYLRGAVKKEPIPKHSIVGEEANRKAGYEKYLSQIVCYIE